MFALNNAICAWLLAATATFFAHAQATAAAHRCPHSAPSSSPAPPTPPALQPRTPEHSDALSPARRTGTTAGFEFMTGGGRSPNTSPVARREDGSERARRRVGGGTSGGGEVLVDELVCQLVSRSHLLPSRSLFPLLMCVVDELVCQLGPSKCQQRPSKCQKRPSKCQQRPSKCQKRPIKEVLVDELVSQLGERGSTDERWVRLQRKSIYIYIYIYI